MCQGVNGTGTAAFPQHQGAPRQFCPARSRVEIPTCLVLLFIPLQCIHSSSHWEKILMCFIIIKPRSTLWVNYLYGRSRHPQRLTFHSFTHMKDPCVERSSLYRPDYAQVFWPILAAFWCYNQIICVCSGFDKLNLKEQTSKWAFPQPPPLSTVFQGPHGVLPGAGLQHTKPESLLALSFMHSVKQHFVWFFIKIFLTEIFKAINSVLHDCSCWIIVC